MGVYIILYFQLLNSEALKNWWKNIDCKKAHFEILKWKRCVVVLVLQSSVQSKNTSFYLQNIFECVLLEIPECKCHLNLKLKYERSNMKVKWRTKFHGVCKAFFTWKQWPAVNLFSLLNYAFGGSPSFKQMEFDIVKNVLRNKWSFKLHRVMDVWISRSDTMLPHTLATM